MHTPVCMLGGYKCRQAVTNQIPFRVVFVIQNYEAIHWHAHTQIQTQNCYPAKEDSAFIHLSQRQCREPQTAVNLSQLIANSNNVFLQQPKGHGFLSLLNQSNQQPFPCGKSTCLLSKPYCIIYLFAKVSQSWKGYEECLCSFKHGNRPNLESPSNFSSAFYCTADSPFFKEKNPPA